MRIKPIILLILLLGSFVSIDAKQSDKNQRSIFIYGEVEKEGEYLFTEGLTLRKAIALAEGVTLYADMQTAYIFHINPTNEERDGIKVKLNEVLSGKEPDIALRPNDMIVVLNKKNSQYK